MSEDQNKTPTTDVEAVECCELLCPDCNAKLEVHDEESYKCPAECGYYHKDTLFNRETCSGCYEGYELSHLYRWHPVLKIRIGDGCNECNGKGYILA